MATETKAPEQTPAPAASKQVVVPPKKSGGSNKTLIIVLIIVAVVVVLPGLIFGAFLLWFSSGNGAEKISESLIEQSTGGNVDINSDDGSFTLENDEGSFNMGNGQELPEDFPSDVPLYPEQNIRASYHTANENGTTWSVTAETDATATTVRTYMTEKFSGWENEGDFTITGSSTTSYKRGNMRVALSVSSDTESGKTSIGYIVTQEK